MNVLVKLMCCGVALTLAGQALMADQMTVADRDHYRYEFRASTFAPSAQSEAALAVDAADNITVVWSSRRQQGGCYGVYAQRFTPEGIARGGETAVNLWSQSHQSAPDIAADSCGNLWIVWQSHGQDGHAGAIVARRCDAALQGGSEILVNQQWRGHQSDPIVVTGPRGEALFVWSSTETAKSPQQLRARLFEASGRPAGDEFAVRQEGAVAVRAPAAGFGTDGGFVIAYSVFGSDNRPAGVYLQRFASNGKRAGNELRVSGPLKNSQIEPVIAATSDGYIVCWLDAESDGDDYGVLARRLDAKGGPLGDPFLVNTKRSGPQSAAAIAVARDGRFVIAWNSSDQDESGVFAQFFAPDGRRLGSEFRINKHTDGKQALRGVVSNHRLALGANGELICAWNGDAGLGDKSSVNVTLLTPKALELAGKVQGVTEAMKPAGPAVALAGGPEPHRPPTFNPADIDDAEREIRWREGDFGFTAIISTGWTPPDPHLAVGPEHIAVMTNGAIAFFTKDGTKTFQDEIEDSYGFWGSVGATGFVFDPEVLYDETSGRFFAMAAEAFAPGSRSYVLVAVSDDSDPNGTWYKYRFDTTGFAGNLFDSPNIGVDRTAVYITGDGFGYTANYPVYIFDKGSLLAGNPPVITNSFTLATSTQSAGYSPVTDGAGLLYLIEHEESYSNNSVRLIALQDGLGSPNVIDTRLTVPSYGRPEDPPQQGSSGRPETFDARFWSVSYRNGSLWATHHINSDRVLARWYEIAMNGWPLSGDDPELVQSGEIDPGPGIRTFFCSISVDDAGNAAMAFARSSPSEYISMGTTYRLRSDPLGEFRPVAIQQESTSPETSGRWGDYSEIEPDPVSPGTFWAHHEYRTSGWRTWVARVIVATPGDLDGDGDVDLNDLGILLSNYGNTSGMTYADGDLDGDGDVDLTDLGILLTYYGT